MGIFYGVQGKMKVRDNEESRELLSYLEDGVGEIQVESEDHDDGTFTVEVNGGMHCSYSTAEDVDDKLMAFGPHVVTPARFATDCDGENGHVWVGDEKEVETAQRAELVEEARAAIKKLTPEEWEALHDEATSPHFWIGK